MGEYIFKMPDIGEGVVEAEITAWHVMPGDKVSEEDPIADAMTDKATIELTAPVEGIITDIGCEAGDMLAVGAMLAVFETQEALAIPPDIASRPEQNKHAGGKPKKPPPLSALAPPAADQLKPVSAPQKRLASPAVRARARKAGLNLEEAMPTGALGQITHMDLDRLTEALLPEPGETRIKVIGLRRVIAERMQASKRHIPHFTYVEEIDMSALEALRAKANERSANEKSANEKRANNKRAETRPDDGAAKLTVLPFIIRALSLTLKDWPQFNARYHDDKGFISQYSELNLGLAAQTDKGLIVPVLKNAGSLSIWEIAAEITRLAQGARENKLSAAELNGASTTLTSLGPLGGIVTTPVINRPEVAIFGPNKIRSKLELRGGALSERKVMNFSVSCDHRVIDGYDAAKMMQDLKALLEDPQLMFLL